MRGRKLTQKEYKGLWMSRDRAKKREAKAKKLARQIKRAGDELWLLLFNTKE